MTNLGLKLKVFFLMAVVITALSAANFLLFKDFIVKIDTQEGAQNAAALVEEGLKNINYSLIETSFSIANGLKASKGKISSDDTESTYVIVNNSGAVVYSSNFNMMSSYAGVPAVDRALKDGVASDGMLGIEKELYLIGVAPVAVEGKIFAVVSVKKFSNDLLSVFPMPVRVFRGSDLLAEKGDNSWNSVENSYGKSKLDADVSEMIKSGGQKALNGWTRISAFFMPYDLAGGEKITIITMTSMIPGWESYDKVLYMVVAYSVIAILIALFFTFIVTHEIDKILKNLASDVSRMRVGEKLVLKRYSNGADIVVSAMNKLIQQYLELNEDVDGIASSPLGRERGQAKGMDDFNAAVPDPFATESVDENKVEREIPERTQTSKPEVSRKPRGNTEVKPVVKAEPAPAPVEEDYDDEDEDNEKTQIAATVASVQANPFDVLWDDYCRIKRKNGESVSEKEKTNFIGKVRTNKASIMAKYKCADVQFTVEEKDGKPVVKAKPVN